MYVTMKILKGIIKSNSDVQTVIISLYSLNLQKVNFERFVFLVTYTHVKVVEKIIQTQTCC